MVPRDGPMFPLIGHYPTLTFLFFSLGIAYTHRFWLHCGTLLSYNSCRSISIMLDESGIIYAGSKCLQF